MSWLRQHLGELSIGLGLTHLLWGVVEYRRVIPGLVRDGWWMSISGEHQTERSDFFWFMVGGVSTISEGLLIRSLLRHGARIPRSYALINLGVMAAIGTGFPRSGAPVGLALSALLLTGGEPAHR
jgi:hypothetical protein